MIFQVADDTDESGNEQSGTPFAYSKEVGRKEAISNERGKKKDNLRKGKWTVRSN